jgi:2-oxoglutarate ferredoxin oxidoreductase subunit beta
MELLPGFPTPLGVFRSVDLPRYEDRMAEQIHHAVQKRGYGDLEALLRAGDTWEVK